MSTAPADAERPSPTSFYKYGLYFAFGFLVLVFSLLNPNFFSGPTR